MIDRKTFWTVMALVAIMLIAAAWRVSLLPDWTQLPRYGVDGAAVPPINSAILLVAPIATLFGMALVTARLTWRARTAKFPGESLNPWKKWAGILLVPVSLLQTLAQALIITRSLGLLLINPVLFSRVTVAITGLVVITVSNALPKLPWLRSRIAFFDLDSDTGAKFLRVQGWLGVLYGLGVVLSGLFLPFKIVVPVIGAMTVVLVIIRAILPFFAKRGQLQ